MAAQNSSSEADPRIDIGNPYTPRRPSPIIGISINHPFATAARKIKNFLVHKQTLFSTTFSIKITPIVAIVSLFGVFAIFGGGITTAFQYGKTVEQKFLASTLTPTPDTIQHSASPTPTPLIVSKAGTIQATYQELPTPTAAQSSDEIASSSPTPRNDEVTTAPRPVLHYILVSRSGSITYIAPPSTIHLANYLGIRVLIIGTLSNNTLTITKPEDIEVLQ